MRICASRRAIYRCRVACDDCPRFFIEFEDEQGATRAQNVQRNGYKVNHLSYHPRLFRHFENGVLLDNLSKRRTDSLEPVPSFKAGIKSMSSCRVSGECGEQLLCP